MFSFTPDIKVQEIKIINKKTNEVEIISQECKDDKEE